MKSQIKNKLELHPDHKPQINRLKRIGGQIEGIEKMIMDRRYCPDIITQIRAVQSAMRSLEVSILEKHIQHCVKDALNSKNKSKQDKKISELLELFQRS